MTELKNLERELDRFRGRLLAAAAFVLLAFGLLGYRLVVLQVLRHDDLATQAEANRISVVPIVPNRGLIVDRNGIVLATNYSAYTLEITPSRAAPLEPLIDRLATVVDITARDRKRFKRLLEESKSFESLPLRTRLSEDEVARFTAQRFRFPGVDVKARLFRNYPLGEVGSHLLGYIGRINTTEKKAMEDWTDEDQANYKGTEYIGKLGLEQAYERELHGSTGFEEMETSAGGPRGAPPGQPRRHRRQHAGAVDRHPAAGPGGRDVRRTSRRPGGAGPAHGARCWPSSASPPSTPTCSSTASTWTAGAISTKASTSRC